MIPAFLLGGMSSLHCVGMCGPLVMALPVQALPGTGKKLMGILLYNAGRISSYIALGAVAGIAGRFIFVPAWQHWLSIAAGVIILLVSLLQLGSTVLRRFPAVPGIYTAVYKIAGHFMRYNSPLAFYVLGMANGLLPCGLVFIALTSAFVTNSIYGGMLFMGMYGLGTMPLMASISLLGITVGLPLRNAFKRTVPFLTLMAGVLLVLRGFHVTIPIISYWLPEHIDSAGCGPLN